MSLSNKIIKYSIDIDSSDQFSDMAKILSSSLWNLHTSNPPFWNYLLKESRIDTISILMYYIYVEKIDSLHEFYTTCIVNGYSGKNNLINLIDFMSHTKRIELIVGTDRRKRKPQLTALGINSLTEIVSCLLYPLSKFDRGIENVNISDSEFKLKYYKNYYSLFTSEKNEKINYKTLPLLINKSSGIAFIFKIYNETLNGDLLINKKYPRHLLMNYHPELGISRSHIINLIKSLEESQSLACCERYFTINETFLLSMRKLTSILLARVYFYYKN